MIINIQAESVFDIIYGHIVLLKSRNMEAWRHKSTQSFHIMDKYLDVCGCLNGGRIPAHGLLIRPPKSCLLWAQEAAHDGGGQEWRLAGGDESVLATGSPGSRGSLYQPPAARGLIVPQGRGLILCNEAHNTPWWPSGSMAQWGHVLAVSSPHPVSHTQTPSSSKWVCPDAPAHLFEHQMWAPATFIWSDHWMNLDSE